MNDLLEKRIRVKEVCTLYGVTRASVYKWIYLYSNLEKGTKMVVQMESEASRTQVLLNRVAELERIIGQKQMEIDFQNVCFEVATEELGFDVKKKYAPTRLNGSAKGQPNTVTP